MSIKNRAIFLDRDGVILKVEKGKYINTVEDVDFIPGAAEGLRKLHEAGWKCIIISNQAGVGKQFLSYHEMNAIDCEMCRQVIGSGGEIAASMYCPHKAEDGCGCRKPKSGLLLDAAQIEGLDLSQCVMIGDMQSDIDAGKNAGCKTIFVESGIGDVFDTHGYDAIAKDLNEAADLVIGGEVVPYCDLVSRYMNESLETLCGMETKAIKIIGDEILAASKNGRMVYLAGNGGSAATCSHLAGDFSKGCGIGVYSLTDNIPVITAWGNDTCFEDIFKHQIAQCFQQEDVLIVLSGSGNSENLVRAVDLANAKDGITIGLLGGIGGKLLQRVKRNIVVKSDDMQHIEDMHLLIGHCLFRYCREKIGQEASHEEG